MWGVSSNPRRQVVLVWLRDWRHREAIDGSRPGVVFTASLLAAECKQSIFALKKQNKKHNTAMLWVFVSMEIFKPETRRANVMVIWLKASHLHLFFCFLSLWAPPLSYRDPLLSFIGASDPIGSSQKEAKWNLSMPKQLSIYLCQVKIFARGWAELKQLKELSSITLCSQTVI